MAESQVGKAERTAKAGPNHNLQGLLLEKRGPKSMGVHKEVQVVFPLMFLTIFVRPKTISIQEKFVVSSFRRKFSPLRGQ